MLPAGNLDALPIDPAAFGREQHREQHRDQGIQVVRLTDTAHATLKCGPHLQWVVTVVESTKMALSRTGMGAGSSP